MLLQPDVPLILRRKLVKRLSLVRQKLLETIIAVASTGLAANAARPPVQGYPVHQPTSSRDEGGV